MFSCVAYWFAVSVVFSVQRCQGIDGSLSSEQLTALVAKADASKDGTVTLEELMKFSAATDESKSAKETEDKIEKADTDKSGSLTYSELKKYLERENLWSPNDDVSKRQRKFLKRYFNKVVNMVDPDKSKGDQKPSLANSEVNALFFKDIDDGMRSIEVDDNLKHQDADGDGKLTIKEFWHGNNNVDDSKLTDDERKHFAQADTDKDGFVSSQEIMNLNSGIPKVEEDLRNLIKIADEDNDQQVSAAELVKAKVDIAKKSDALDHLYSWVQHHEL